MYSPNGQGPAAGSSVPVSCNYVTTSTAELHEAVERGLVDATFMHRLRRSCPELVISPTAWIVQGAYSGTTVK
jgi:hypothetical protein